MCCCSGLMSCLLSMVQRGPWSTSSFRLSGRARSVGGHPRGWGGHVACRRLSGVGGVILRHHHERSRAEGAPKIKLEGEAQNPPTQPQVRVPDSTMAMATTEQNKPTLVSISSRSVASFSLLSKIIISVHHTYRSRDIH
jgi:hypothetical protein